MPQEDDEWVSPVQCFQVASVDFKTFVDAEEFRNIKSQLAQQLPFIEFTDIYGGENLFNVDHLEYLSEFSDLITYRARKHQASSMELKRKHQKEMGTWDE